jgi:hypothetical protein
VYSRKHTVLGSGNSPVVNQGKTTLLLICLVTMDKIASVEGGKQAVVQYIFVSETNNFALEISKSQGAAGNRLVRE